VIESARGSIFGGAMPVAVPTMPAPLQAGTPVDTTTPGAGGAA
jgi:hypothetical protein